MNYTAIKHATKRLGPGEFIAGGQVLIYVGCACGAVHRLYEAAENWRCNCGAEYQVVQLERLRLEVRRLGPGRA